MIGRRRSGVCDRGFVIGGESNDLVADFESASATGKGGVDSADDRVGAGHNRSLEGNVGPGSLLFAAELQQRNKR